MWSIILPIFAVIILVASHYDRKEKEHTYNSMYEGEVSRSKELENK